MSIGSRMKERREKLGIKQVQLAEMLGVTKGAIGNYESGQNSPKASIMYKVFDVLQCDANYLFQDEMREYAGYAPPPVEEKTPSDRLSAVLEELNPQQAKFLVRFVEALLARRGGDVYAAARAETRRVWEEE